VAAGAAAVVHDLSSGRVLRRFVSCARAALHSPRVEGTRDGRTLFCGDAEGAVLAYDLRCGPRQASLGTASQSNRRGLQSGHLPQGSEHPEAFPVDVCRCRRRWGGVDDLRWALCPSAS